MPDIPSTFKLNTLAPDTGKQVGYVIVCGQQVGKQGENECEFDVDCKLKVKIAVSSYTFQEISADFYLKWTFTIMILPIQIENRMSRVKNGETNK